jgi:Cu(I)/Ag(I) efflux system membrane fusion protein
MNSKLKRYGLGGLLLVLGVVIGALAFSYNETTKSDSASVEKQSQYKVWTCSMHPQIRQDEEGDCPICGMDLIPANQMENMIDPDAIRMSKTARALAKVETTVVGQSFNSGSNHSFSGQLVINQEQVENVSANYKGRIEKLYINEEGEQIKSGQLIAEIYAPDIQVLKDEYNLALKQDNPTLINSINKKIRNLELTPQAIQSMNNGILKLRAPKSGFVSSLSITQGDNIKASQQLLQIADLSSLWANLDLYESELNTLKVGDEMTIQIPNYNDVKGKVTFISPVLDSNTRSATARLVIDNKNFNLKPGVFISAEIESDSKDDSEQKAIMLPKSSVLWTGKRSVIYQEFEDETCVFYKMKEVSTGKSTANAIEIISGIAVGDVIVTHGAFSIDSEAQLADKPSMMNRSTSASVEVKGDFQLDNNYLQSYFDLKNALVNDDFEKAKNIANEFNESINKQSAGKNPLQNLKTFLDKIIKTSNIDDFRDQFINLSDEMIRLSKTIEIEPKLYVQYCPMANSNEGAYWLSLSNEIRNPYYGESMLKCGEVKEVIEN